MEISAHVLSIDSECKSGSNKCAFFSDLFIRVTKFVSRIFVLCPRCSIRLLFQWELTFNF